MVSDLANSVWGASCKPMGTEGTVSCCEAGLQEVSMWCFSWRVRSNFLFYRNEAAYRRRGIQGKVPRLGRMLGSGCPVVRSLFACPLLKPDRKSRAFEFELDIHIGFIGNGSILLPCLHFLCVSSAWLVFTVYPEDVHFDRTAEMILLRPPRPRLALLSSERCQSLCP